MKLCTQCKHYGRGPYAVVEVCLLEERPHEVSPIDGHKMRPRKCHWLHGKAYVACIIKRAVYPDCPDFEAPPPIKWWQIWRWGE